MDNKLDLTSFKEAAKSSQELFDFIDETLASPPKTTKNGSKYYQFRFWAQKRASNTTLQFKEANMSSLREYAGLCVEKAVRGAIGKLSQEYDTHIDDGDQAVIIEGLIGALTDFYERFLYGEYAHYLDKNKANLLSSDRFPIEGAIDIVAEFNENEASFFAACGIYELDLIEEKIRKATLLDSWEVVGDASQD